MSEVQAKTPPTTATVSRNPTRRAMPSSGRDLRSFPSTIEASTNQMTANAIEDQ